MTPKRRAKQLTETFLTEIDSNNQTSLNWGKDVAKSCAIILCNEMIAEHTLYRTEKAIGVGVDYWRLVKEEISKCN